MQFPGHIADLELKAKCKSSQAWPSNKACQAQEVDSVCECVTDIIATNFPQPTHASFQILEPGDRDLEVTQLPQFPLLTLFYQLNVQLSSGPEYRDTRHPRQAVTQDPVSAHLAGDLEKSNV